MNVLELAQQMYCLQQKLDKHNSDYFVDNHIISAHFNSYLCDGLKFSSWDKKFNHRLAPVFNAEFELLRDSDYPGDIGAAREALKQYLAQELE